jgi:hypothetical protein
MFFQTSSFSKNNIIEKSNKKSLFDEKNVSFKCNHKDKICAFYLGGENNFICLKCIYNYDINQNDYIPLDHKVDDYIRIYKDYIDKMKTKIKSEVNEILKELDKLELDEKDNFESVFEKIDLKFELPIEVSFEQRLKISNNRKLSKLLNNLLDSQLLDNCLNLYKTEIENIKTISAQSIFFNNEVIKLKPEIPFILKGLMIPNKSKEDCQKDIIFSFKKRVINVDEEKSTILFSSKNEEEKINNLEEIKVNVNFEKREDNSFTIVRFDKSIPLNNNEEFEISISGFSGYTLIDSSEEYNYHNKLLIKTNRNDSILAGILIE